MDIVIPKQLENALESLFEENLLSSWTIQGFTNQTTVTLRFKMEDTVTEDTVKYRRVSKSQMDRDRDRAKAWHEQDRSAELDTLPQTQASGDLDAESDSIPIPTQPSKPKLKPKPQPSPRVTRSKTHLSAKAKAFTPSPLPQVDGASDAVKTSPPHHHNVNSTPVIDQAALRRITAHMDAIERSQEETLCFLTTRLHNDDG